MRVASAFLFTLCFIAISCMFVTSCKKEVIHEVHRNDTIPGNKVPNYTGVPTLNINLYVNKLYVDMLGREPSTDELNENANYLISHNLSDSARGFIATKLLSDTSFYSRLFELTSSDFLEGTGYTDIQDQINLILYVKYLDSIQGNDINVSYYNFELGRLYNVYNAADDLKDKKINLNEFYRRFLDNFFYDEVNMGTENFCKASFQNLFYRDPTTSELDNATKMVNGAPSNVFLQDGNDKGSYEKIVTGCDEFFQGYVIKIYLQYLLRKPSSGEIADGINIIKPAGDYKSLHLKLVKSKEYAGF